MASTHRILHQFQKYVKWMAQLCAILFFLLASLPPPFRFLLLLRSKQSMSAVSTLFGLYQDPEGSQTSWRPPDHRKEAQTEVVWTCLPFIGSGQKRCARHIERGKKTRQTEKEVGKQHQAMNRPGVCHAPRGQWRTEKNGENRLWSHLWCPDDPQA